MKLRYILFLFVFYAACNNGPNPKDLNYPEETVAKVIVDLYVASEAVKDLNPEDKDSLIDVYKVQIAGIHNVDFNLMEDDIALVRSNDAWYTKIHKIVNDSINNMEQNYQKITAPKRAKPIPGKNLKKKK
jgi:hypothetical protein